MSTEENNKLERTFWLQADGREEWEQVTQNAYIRAERQAGFTNKDGLDDEPAASSFHYRGPFKTMNGEVITTEPFEMAVTNDPNTPSVKENSFKALYAIRWMSRDYEPGWGVDDQEEFCKLFKTMHDAQNSVELKFKDKRILWGAGDYFTYPSGPDDKYHIYEVPVVENHRIFDVISEGGLVIPRLPEDPNAREFRKQLILRMQSPDAIIHTINFEGLSPKPMQEAPTHCFPDNKNPQWVDIAPMLTK